MLKQTHQAFGLSVGTLTAYQAYQHHIDATTLFQVNTQTSNFTGPLAYAITASMFLAGVYIGSTLPDIDQQIPGLRHRGITHSIFFPLLLALIPYGISHYPAQQVQVMGWYPLASLTVLWIGIVFGVLTHILADFFSVQGISLLYPFQGYRDYGNGVSVAKGPRLPLYHVGQPFLGFLTGIWWVMIAAIALALFFGMLVLKMIGG